GPEYGSGAGVGLGVGVGVGVLAARITSGATERRVRTGPGLLAANAIAPAKMQSSPAAASSSENRPLITPPTPIPYERAATPSQKSPSVAASREGASSGMLCPTPSNSSNRTLGFVVRMRCAI